MNDIPSETLMRIKFETWALFTAVVREGSFLAAGRALGIDPASLMRRINRLEEDLELQLFSRGEAGLTLTVSGRRLFREVAPLVARMEAALAKKGAPGGEGAGSAPGCFGLVCSGDFALDLVRDAAARIGARHPAMRWDFRVTWTDDAPSAWNDTFPAVSVRARTQVARESRTAIPLGNVRRLCAASPEFLETHAPLLSPADLEELPAALTQEAAGVVAARDRIREVFERNGEYFPVELCRPTLFRQAGSAVRIALDGEAVAVGIPEALLRPFFLEGRLVPLLRDWCMRPMVLEADVSARWRSNPVVLEFLEAARTATNEGEAR